jgi:hypothetical protein
MVFIIFHAQWTHELKQVDNYHHRFPKSWSFGEGAPGLDLLKAIAYRCQHFLSLFLELSVVAFIIIHERDQDGQLLTLLTATLLWVLFFAPRNGAEDQGSNSFGSLYPIFSLSLD